jgi:hypothetical protein
MNINWQNLTTAIQNGSAAYNNSGVGSPIDTGAIGFYDHPMSDLNQSSAEEFNIRPNDFVIGSSKWGGSDLVT